MKWTRILLIIVVAQSAALAGRWSVNSPARAADNQVPDALNGRGTTNEELRALNGKMDRLLDLLESGKLQVRIAQPDDGAKEPAKPTR